MKLNFRKTLIQLILIATTIITVQAQSLGWRGPGRSGIYNETGLLKSWPASGPALLWESTGNGTGYSSVTVTDDAIYITGRKGGSDYLTAYSQDGKKIWDVEYGISSKSNFPDTRCTPTVSNGKIFLVSGQGDMVCVSKQGKVIWTVNYYQECDASIPMFGVSESPLVIGDLVIGTPCGKKASVIAFNTGTGKVVWTTPSIGQGTQYVNPLYIDDLGIKLIISMSEGFILAVNPSDGKLVWKFDYENANTVVTNDRNHCNTPLYRDGYLLAANGYGQEAVKLKLSPGGSTPSVVWKNGDFNPHIGGMILIGNYLYGSTHDSNSKGRWICADWTTGKTMWTTLWFNKGPIIAGDGMIYIMEEKSGNVALVKPDSQKLDIVSSFKITKGEGPYWAHPVLDKGRLFIRHGGYLAVYSVK